MKLVNYVCKLLTLAMTIVFIASVESDLPVVLIMMLVLLVLVALTILTGVIADSMPDKHSLYRRSKRIQRIDREEIR